MWAQLQLPWLKTSKSNHHRPFPSSSSSLPQSPIHHNHSPSLKDLHTLFTNHPSPFSPLHKPSLSFSSSTPGRAETGPARNHHHHHSLSFKDIESLSSDTAAAKKSSIFHRVKTWANRYQAQAQVQAQPLPQPPPNSLNKLVIYFTSLHVVRRTYEDCRAVRSILKGYNIKMDERDVSMDVTFIEELNNIMINARESGKIFELPIVYVNGKYIGGVEEIRRLHESGELKKLIKGLPLAEKGVCEFCGGFRFSVCDWCHGSHRVFVSSVGYKACNVCNVNGMILCPSCTSVFF